MEYGLRNIKSYQKVLSNLLSLGNILLKCRITSKKVVVDYKVVVFVLYIIMQGALIKKQGDYKWNRTLYWDMIKIKAKINKVKSRSDFIQFSKFMLHKLVASD